MIQNVIKTSMTGPTSLLLLESSTEISCCDKLKYCYTKHQCYSIPSFLLPLPLDCFHFWNRAEKGRGGEGTWGRADLVPRAPTVGGPTTTTSSTTAARMIETRWNIGENARVEFVSFLPARGGAIWRPRLAAPTLRTLFFRTFFVPAFLSKRTLVFHGMYATCALRISIRKIVNIIVNDVVSATVMIFIFFWWSMKPPISVASIREKPARWNLAKRPREGSSAYSFLFLIK